MSEGGMTAHQQRGPSSLCPHEQLSREPEPLDRFLQLPLRLEPDLYIARPRVVRHQRVRPGDARDGVAPVQPDDRECAWKKPVSAMTLAREAELSSAPLVEEEAAGGEDGLPSVRGLRAQGDAFGTKTREKGSDLSVRLELSAQPDLGEGEEAQGDGGVLDLHAAEREDLSIREIDHEILDPSVLPVAGVGEWRESVL